MLGEGMPMCCLHPSERVSPVSSQTREFSASELTNLRIRIAQLRPLCAESGRKTCANYKMRSDKKNDPKCVRQMTEIGR